MTPQPPGRRRFRLRNLMFFALLLSGIIPLALSNLLLLRGNRQALEEQQRTYLVTSAQALSREVGDTLRGVRRRLALAGEGLLAAEGPQPVDARLRQGWVEGYLERMLAEERGDLAALRVLAPNGEGPRIAAETLTAPAEAALDAAFAASRASGRPDYEFRVVAPGDRPMAALAVPVAGAGSEPALWVEGLLPLASLGRVFGQQAGGPDAGLFVVGADGKLLWSRGLTPEMQAAALKSEVVAGFVRHPMSFAGDYELTVGGKRKRFLAQVSPVEETGWGVVVQRPRAAVFQAVDAMVFNTVLLSLLLIALALFFALYFARRFSQPIQRLAATSHEIAAGNFGRRVEAGGLSSELTDLADDFNLMSDHVERYVARLQQAVRINRELFIGSLRAFAAAIDAKDPYTRGHSERVASLARAVARHLSLPEEVQEKIWIGALLHDVGKIGIDDSILKKSGVLTPEEYVQVRAHPVIGADILSPIEQLRDVLPAVRWHHECWNGRGYPDGLRGEAIPLAARIVAVADTFDAVTTTRPYSGGYTGEFALETITRLAGSRFDAKIVTAFLHAYQRGEIPADVTGRIHEDPAAEIRIAGVH
jgi:HD-GYP domain-containing protein (c-di-GMP phosphodiesterase class II)